VGSADLGRGVGCENGGVNRWGLSVFLWVRCALWRGWEALVCVRGTILPMYPYTVVFVFSFGWRGSNVRVYSLVVCGSVCEKVLCRLWACLCFVTGVPPCFRLCAPSLFLRVSCVSSPAVR